MQRASSTCIVQGCLSLRTGANMCAPHDTFTSRLAEMRAPIMAQEQADRLAIDLLLLSALHSRVKAAESLARAELQAMLTPGSSLRPALTDGTLAGLVSLPPAADKAMITDPDALARWVMKRYPTEVALKVTVADAFQAKIIAMTQAAGQPCGPGGEVGPDAPPGVAVRRHQGGLRVTPNKERAAELWEAARAQTQELTKHE